MSEPIKITAPELVSVKGFHLIHPQIQHQAIPAVPLDAVLVPSPTAPLAFGEFLDWVIQKFNEHLASEIGVTGAAVRGWEFDARPDREELLQFLIIHIDTNEGVQHSERFMVGELAWIETHAFWTNASGFRKARLNAIDVNGLEAVPDEDAR